MDLRKARKLFELGRGEGIWMSETHFVNRRAYASFSLEHAVLTEPRASKVPVDIAGDYEGVGVLRKAS